MESLLTVKSSRISSLKSLLFPMQYDFYKDDNGKLLVVQTTKNWIGQKTIHKQMVKIFKIKGVILRNIIFTKSKYSYGRFWSSDCKKVQNILEEYTPENKRIEWSNSWF